MTDVTREPTQVHSLTRWIEQVGEAELLGGWAEVALADDVVAALGSAPYQVFLTPYDPVMVFVQRRTPTSFEIHTCPLVKGRRPRVMRCAWQVVACARSPNSVDAMR